MKLPSFLIALFLLSTPFAFADCGDVPNEPVILSQEQLITSQLEGVEEQMDAYFNAVESYIDCVDGLVSQLIPSSNQTAEEYFESQVFLTEFQNLSLLLDQAEQLKLQAIDRFNHHVETSVSAN